MDTVSIPYGYIYILLLYTITIYYSGIKNSKKYFTFQTIKFIIKAVNLIVYFLW